MTSRRTTLQALGAAALAAGAPWRAHAEAAWPPAKGIRFVVPFVPGGTSDIVGRAVATELTSQLGVPVVVDNKAGGGGVPAMQDVMRSPADGSTVILGHVGSLAVNPLIFKDTGYDVNRDFAPVTLLVKVPSLFVVHRDVPVKDFKSFIAYAKARPGQLNYGSAGNASAGHLAMECLKLATGTFMTHIPYRGTGPALTDLLAGRLQVFSAGTPALLQHIRSGALRCIATGTRQRVPVLPDVPTVAEMGYPDFETVQWYGMLAHARTPPEILERLQRECFKALRTPAVAERFAAESAVVDGGPGSQFAAFIAREQVRWKEVVVRGKVRPD